MTTKALIEQAKWEIEHIEEVMLMPTYRELISKFEKAFDEIHKDCSNCKYKELGKEENPCHSCFGCYGDEDNHWEWRGDTE